MTQKLSIEKSIDDWGLWIIDKEPADRGEIPVVWYRVWALPIGNKSDKYDVYILPSSMKWLTVNRSYRIGESVPRDKVDSVMMDHLKQKLNFGL